MTYGNSGCGLKTHTALGCTSYCVGLSTTPPTPIIHVLNFKHTLSITHEKRGGGGREGLGNNYSLPQILEF